MVSLWCSWCFDSKRFLVLTTCTVLIILLYSISPIDTIKTTYDSVSFPELATTTKTSRLHYLIPASDPTLKFCANVVSVLANRYPIPAMLGYKGEGEFDAKAAHIAKLRSIQRYLHGPAGEKEDDLVIVVDGYDVLAQLPAEVMVERYFEIMDRADKHLADRYGITVDEAHERDLRQTLLWGADKGCFPPQFNEPQCWGLPHSSLPHNVYGRHTHDGSLTYNDPVYINSGTVIGPLGDLRDYIDAALVLINNTWNADFKYRNSDQFYLGKLFARQETNRTKAITGGDIPGLTGDRFLPPPQDFGTNKTDYHVAIDYESAFTCTQCGNEIWMRNLAYNRPDHTAMMEEDVGTEKESFKPFPIQMPGAVMSALTRLYESTVHEKPVGEWIQSVKLGTNVATGHIYAIYHGTCNKNNLLDRYRALWLYPIAKGLLRSAAQAIRAKEPLSTREIDGRLWVPITYYPTDRTLVDPLGGVYTDSNNQKESFIPFSTLCNSHLFDLFQH